MLKKNVGKTWQQAPGDSLYEGTPPTVTPHTRSIVQRALTVTQLYILCYLKPNNEQQSLKKTLTNVLTHYRHQQLHRRFLQTFTGAFREINCAAFAFICVNITLVSVKLTRGAIFLLYSWNPNMLVLPHAAGG